MTTPILVLWAVPRSTSTAFEWMMRMRGDLTCFHEPFGEAWYKGDDARWPRLTADSPRVPGLTSEQVWETLRAAQQQGPVFVKEFFQYVDHMADDDFLAHFTHSFLIRDPGKVLPSVNKNWEYFVEREIGFTEQRQLFDRLADRLGHAPPVIDSDDLLRDPHGVVSRYCDGVGIPFLADALSWEPGERTEVLWYDTEGTWHHQLKASDGLKPQPVTYGDISGSPDFVKEMFDRALPHYEYLRQFRV